MSSTPFIALNETLARAGTVCDAAESHGTVCGVLCAGAGGGDAWLAHLMEEASGPDGALKNCRRDLLALRDLTRNLLDAGTLEFTPLLPDDDISLAERTAALGEWCQGFLYGLGLAGERLNLDELAEEAGEVLRDIGQIAQAGFEGDADDDEDEAAYVEIVEYVRVGVQLLYEELQPASISRSGTLH